jgi:hypothetical protein
MSNKNNIYNAVMLELGQTNPPDMADIRAAEALMFTGMYDRAVDQTLSVRNWFFLKSRAEIDGELREDLDGGKWKFRFLIPEGLLRVNGVYASEKCEGRSIRYELKNEYFYTDSERLFIDYIAKPCEEKMPPWFVNYLVYYIARRLCIPITGDAKLMAVLRQNEVEALKEAFAADIHNQPVKFFPTDTFISCRN